MNTSGNPGYEITQDRIRNIEIIRMLDPTFPIQPNNVDFDSEAFEGSVQQNLSENIGAYVIIDFLIGTTGITSREGVLAQVGRSYILIFDIIDLKYILCDAFSVKFVNFPLNVSIEVARGARRR